MGALKEALSSTAYIYFNRSLAKVVGNEGAILFGYLVNEEAFWKREDRLDKNGFFYCPQSRIQEAVNLTKHEQRTAIKKFIELRLIQIKRYGVPPKYWYKLCGDSILRYVLSFKHQKSTPLKVKKLTLINKDNKPMNLKDEKKKNSEAKTASPRGSQMKPEEHVLAGKKKSEESSARRKAKRESKDYNTPAFRRWLSDTCHELGVFMNKTWTGRDWRSAKNFLKYFEESGEDWKVFMREVIKNWNRVRDGAIKTKYGKPITLPRVFDFGEFFKFRLEVMDFLKFGRKKTGRTQRFEYYNKAGELVDVTEEEI